MLIKTDEFELEISKGGDIYLGSLKKGQTFLKWSDLDESIKTELETIISKAKRLIMDSENLLLNPCPGALNSKNPNQPTLLHL